MLKKVVAVFLAAAVIIGCLATVGYAAEQTSGTKWEVVANTGFEGAKTSWTNVPGVLTNAVNTGDIMTINPGGWYTLSAGGSQNSMIDNIVWSDSFNSNVLSIGLEKSSATASRDRIAFFRGNANGLLSPHFFTEANKKYRVSFDVALGGVKASNAEIALQTSIYPNEQCASVISQDIGKKEISVKESAEFEKSDFTRLTYEFTSYPIGSNGYWNSVPDQNTMNKLGLIMVVRFPNGRTKDTNAILQIDNLLIEKGTAVKGDDFRNLTDWSGSYTTNSSISVTPKETTNQWTAGGQTLDGYNAPLILERACTWGDNTGFIIKSDKFKFTEDDLGKVITVKFCAAPYGFVVDTTKIAPEDCRVVVSAVMNGSEKAHTQLGYAVGANVGGDLSKAKFTEFTYSFVVTKKTMDMNQIEVRFNVSPFVNKYTEGVNQLTGNNLLRIAVDNVRIYNENPHQFVNTDSSVMIYGPETVNMNEYLLGVYNADGMLTNVFKRGLNKFTTYVAGMKTIKAFSFDEDNLTPQTNTVLTKGF